MSMYASAMKQLCKQTGYIEGGRDSASQLMHGNPICQSFSKMPQVRTMRYKPGCIQTLPTGSKSS